MTESIFDLINELNDRFLSQKSGFQYNKKFVLNLLNLKRWLKSNTLPDETLFTQVDTILLSKLLTPSSIGENGLLKEVYCGCLYFLYLKNVPKIKTTFKKLLKVLSSYLKEKRKNLSEEEERHISFLLYCMGILLRISSVSVRMIMEVTSKLLKHNNNDIKRGLLFVFRSSIQYFTQKEEKQLISILKYCTKEINDNSMEVYQILVEVTKINIFWKSNKIVNLLKWFCLHSTKNKRKFGKILGEIVFKTMNNKTFEDKVRILLKLLHKKNSNVVVFSIIHFLTVYDLNKNFVKVNFVLTHLMSLFYKTKSIAVSIRLSRKIGKIIRAGFVNNLDESKKLLFLNELIKIPIDKNVNTFLLICILRELTNLCEILGELIITSKKSIIETILCCLRNRNEYVRYIGTVALRSFGKTTSNELTLLIASLLTMVQMDHVEMIEKSNPLNCSKLTGHANALASLIALSSKNNLSKSYLLSSASLDTAHLLLKPTRTISHSEMCVRRRAAFIIVAGLLSLNDYWIKLKTGKIFQMWDSVMNEEVISSKIVSKDDEFFYFVKSYSYVLFSVSRFLKLCSSYNVLSKGRLSVIFKYVTNTIALISSFRNRVYENNIKKMEDAVKMLKMYLFETLIVLTDSLLMEQFSTVKFIIKLSYNECIKRKYVNSIFEKILRKEKENFDYFNGNGESTKSISTPELQFEIIPSMILKPLVNSKFEPIEVLLLNSSIKCLGRIFSFQKTITSKNQLIDHFLNQIKFAISSSVLGESTNLFCNIIISVYYILKKLKGNSKENSSFLSKMHSILNATLGNNIKLVRTLGSITLGLLSQSVGESVIRNLIKNCTKKISQKGPIISGYALALGHVNKSIGTFLSHSHITSVVSFLQNLARSEVLETKLCSLKSIHYTIDSTGTQISPHIDSILLLMSRLIFSTKDGGIVEEDILNECSKILNSMVGLGPEVTKNQEFISLLQFILDKFIDDDENWNNRQQSIIIIQKVLIILPQLINLKLIIPKLILFCKLENLVKYSSKCLKIVSKIYPREVYEYLKPEDILKCKFCSEIGILKEILDCYIDKKICDCELWIELIESLVLEPKTQWEIKLACLNCVERLIQLYKIEEIQPFVSRIVQFSTLATKTEVLPSIQKSGIKILTSVLAKFDEITNDNNDPILLKDSIHFGTVISIGVRNENVSPVITQLSCELLSLYISSTILKDDKSGINRMLKHLFQFLPKLLVMRFHHCGEVASSMIKIAILTSLAKVVIKSDKVGLNIFDKYSLISLDYWEKLLEDYARIDFTGERDVNGFEYLCITPTEKTQMTFYEKGTEKEVRSYFKNSYSFILNALTKISQKKGVLNDPTLLIGLAVRDLLEKRDNCISLDSLIRIIPSKHYWSLPHVKKITVEIMCLLLNLQKKENGTEFHLKLLKLVKVILRSAKSKFFFLNEKDVFGLVFEILISTLRITIPIFFVKSIDSTNKEILIKEMKEDEKKIVRRVLNCVKHMIPKFRINTTENFNKLLLILYKLVTFSSQFPCMKPFSCLINEIKKYDNESFWEDGLFSVIEDINTRLRNTLLESQAETELLFICLSKIYKVTSEIKDLNERIAGSIRQFLQECLVINNIHRLTLFLKGFQNGILLLARLGFCQLSIFYLGNTLGSISSQLRAVLKIKNGEKNSSVFEAITCSLNILLVGLQLIQPENKFVYLSSIVPEIFHVVKFVDKNNLKKLKQLCRECLERIKKSDGDEYAKIIQKMPAVEIQQINDIVTPKPSTSKKKGKKKKKKKKISLDL